MCFVFSSCEEKGAHKYTNALVNETSPYLLQHAHNPVNWNAWSKEALERAKKENKLVLVSVGYSSCHWCHVMEEETFEDEEVAKIMNTDFINIKVDREERPDVDQVYMTALQLMKGSGGWPLNVITLPNGKPIYAGTYHTKEQWNKVLVEISGLYKDDPKKANEYADMVAKGIQEVNIIQPSTDFESLNVNVLEESVTLWQNNWDLEWGGNSGHQKFMLPSNLDFLLDFAVLTDNEEALKHVKNTLDKMAWGGVYDHIGGGFFRYSTDVYWKVPHFEKMLYDNAQLISLYSKAYKVFKNPEYKTIVFEISSFLEREMKHPEGGYYAALDADSEGEEGKFYVWKKEELQAILESDYNLFASYFQISDENVWEHNNYVLYKSLNNKDYIQKHQLTKEKLKELKSTWQEKILKARAKRVRPRTDDKIITSWNALLLNGFVDAYKAFGEDMFLKKAQNILKFIQTESYKDNKLIHSYKKGGKQVAGFLEDYAFLTNASLNLYEATMDVTYLEFAKTLHTTTISNFSDAASGMYTYNSNNELISKIIKTDDGVIPSPNAVMAHNLFKLGHLKYDTNAMKKAKEMLSSMVPQLKESGSSYSKWNTLLSQVAKPYYEIAVVGSNADVLLKQLKKEHIPNTLVVGSNIESNLPLFKGRYVENGTYIYVCKNTTCKLPVATVAEALEQLKNF